MAMTDLQNTIKRLLAEKNSPVDVQWALAQLEAHPTFVVLASMLLRRNSDDVDNVTAQRLQATVALGSSDRTAMMDFADMSGRQWDEFYPKPSRKKEKTTDDTIVDFIEVYGHSTPEEDRLLEKLIFNPVAPDYFQGIDQPFDSSNPLALPPELLPTDESNVSVEGQTHDGAPAAETESSINDEKNTEEIVEKESEDAVGKEPLLMESLAQIFIKQRRYERALEIISNLSLNYPEKSVYFADQIRFLQKLVINDRFKTKENT